MTPGQLYWYCTHGQGFWRGQFDKLVWKLVWATNRRSGITASPPAFRGYFIEDLVSFFGAFGRRGKRANVH